MNTEQELKTNGKGTLAWREKTSEQYEAIIAKQDEYIELIEKYMPRLNVQNGDGTYSSEMMFQGGRKLREEIEALKL